MEEAKRCSHCKEYKPLEMFCRNKRTKDGLHFVCKECTSVYQKSYRARNRDELIAYSKAYWRKNKEALKEYHRKYFQDNKENIMTKHREYDKNHLEQRREYNKKYYRTHPDRVKESGNRYRRNNPEKRKAHLLVQYAIRKGELLPQCCEYCGVQKAEAHHDDYNKPLEVRWLCHKCHMEWHMAKRNEVDNNINIGGE